MSVRNIAIAFMMFMVLSFAAIIALFIRLGNLTEDNKMKDVVIESSGQEIDAFNDLLEANKTKLKKLNNFRTLALDQCDELEVKYPTLQEVPDSITKQDLIDDSLWEELNALSIGISYESEGKLNEAKVIMGDRAYNYYYVKKVYNLTNSFVIYYNDNLMDTAVKIAEELKKVDSDFKALKGKTPKSIVNADQANTILILIDG